MLVTRREFDFFLNGVLLHFKNGQVIEEAPLEAELVRLGTPVEKVVEQDDLVQCPHCRRHFTIQHVVEREEAEDD